MTRELPQVREWHNVDSGTFQNEIVPLNQPAVLKGVARDWPAVRAGLRSPRALCDYIRRFDRGRPVETLFGAPAIRGRFFYSDDLTSRNFERQPGNISDLLELLLTHTATRSRRRSSYKRHLFRIVCRTSAPRMRSICRTPPPSRESGLETPLQ